MWITTRNSKVYLLGVTGSHLVGNSIGGAELGENEGLTVSAGPSRRQVLWGLGAC